ncbi:MAG: hypothetical protein CME70_04960 [Halobacteriovorax sp.]|nr:hypothetical protein [Halobacteriovorax sp.]|tara:strand:+ start:8170 stop:8976 length:807 start_codon:yes stop_codon:yes gene_type:complete
MIQIKDFSKKTNFSIRMLRYLEEIELLIPSRGENNYRTYTEGQIEVAETIKELQDTGFQLKEVKSLFENKSELNLELIQKVLERETEVAEIKSETIPKLKYYLEQVQTNSAPLLDVIKGGVSLEKKFKTLGGKAKFHRTAYSIPILRTIYEDHIASEAEVELIATDLMKFGQYLDESKSSIDVYSIFKESSFAFGVNLDDDFIEGYKKSWEKFLPGIGLEKLEEFTREELSELMGIHDVVIRTTLRLKSGVEGEIVVPYTPIYAMSKL